jgi:hypothetical protein
VFVVPLRKWGILATSLSGGLVGVLGQRNSSLLLRITLVLALVFPPNLFAQNGPAAETASILSEKAAAESVRTEVRLPPTLEALLIAIIGACNLSRRGAVEPPGFQPLRREDQLVDFKTVLAALPGFYRNARPYVGAPVQSLLQYVALREPTRVYTGSAASDFRALVQRISSNAISPSVSIDRSQFASVRARVEAEVFEHDRAERLQNLLAGITGSGMLPPTSVASIVKGVVGVLMTSGGLIHGLRTFSKSVGTPASPNAAPAPKDEAASKATDAKGADPKNKGGSAKPVETALPATATTTAMTVPLTMGGIGLIASSGADLLEEYDELVRTEGGIIQLVERIDQLDTSAQLRIISTMQRQFQTVVLPEIYSIGEAAAVEAENQGVRDPKALRLIRLFFSEYPKLLETDAIKDIVLDILRRDLGTSELQLLGILLKHFDPIAQQFFQTVSDLNKAENLEDGKKDLGDLFKELRDHAWAAPYEQIAEIVKADPNNYPLEQLSLEPINAGKLFQVHTAQWRNPDGTLTPVVVRVLKPGMAERLDLAQIRMTRLSPQIAQALKDEAGNGPTERRVRQLIQMIYQNLKKELDIPLTVRNQNRARVRYQRRMESPSRTHGTVGIEFTAPKAYPAKLGSRVMVMDRVTNVISTEKLKNYHAEMVAVLGDAVHNLFIEETLINPMRAALEDKEPAPGEEDRRIGMLHADGHSGNLLVTVSEDENGQVTYRVYIIDFGLMAWVSPTDVENIAKLAVGASYNSTAFIVDAIWKLRDPAMNAWKPEDIREKRDKLQKFVERKTAQLNRERKYLGPADWIKMVWFKEIIDLPDWVVMMEQGFRALTSTYLSMDRTPADLAKREAALGVDHRTLFKQYLSKVAKRHSGWRAVYTYEVGAAVGRCVDFLLRRKPEDLSDD